jgi:hypothetical protein
MATEQDAAAVRDLVTDAARLLQWCAGPQARITADNGENAPAVPVGLRDSYAAAIDQLAAGQLALALATMAGGNDSFPMSRVLAVLASAGWDGALRTVGRGGVMGTLRRESGIQSIPGSRTTVPCRPGGGNVGNRRRLRWLR